MLLGRLRIRGKLALLVVIPLLSMVALAVPVVVDRVDLARRAAATAESVAIASQVGILLQDLQQERLLSLGYLLGGGRLVDRSTLIQQTTIVTDRIADLRTDLGADLPAPIAAAVTDVQTLSELRTGILIGQARPDQVIGAFGQLHLALIDSLRLTENVDTSTSAGRQTLALDAVLRTDEGISGAAATLALAVAAPNPGTILQYVVSMMALQTTIARFTALATPEQNELYTLVSNAAAVRTSPELIEDPGADPTAAIAQLDLETLFPGITSLITLGQFVEKKIVTDILAEVSAQQRGALTTAYLVAGLVLLVLLVVVLLSLTVARTVARPLTRLTLSADRVARLAEAELVRIADDEVESARPIRLDPVDVTGRDEIGDLARAFDRVQGTARRLVERQVASRRNVAQMFGHVGRRTQNLVGRQIALIDRLEGQETEPSRLQHLYRLDHISSRLRRNASSLVVLSGSTGGDGHVAPIPLTDVVRLALGEIEDYTRVDVQVRVDVGVAPGVIGDLVLALAELMENGTSFSPPHTRVTVSAELIQGGVRINLVDHGIGMSAERMADENARLTRRERLDLTPTEVLGLFVVGRLARRHDWRVVLSPTSGGGVTVELAIADRLLVSRRPETPLAAIAPSAPVPAITPAPAITPSEVIAPVTAVARVRVPSASDPTHTPDVGPPPPDTAPDVGPAGTPDRNTADPIFDPELLSRATQSLDVGQPWDAFATRPDDRVRPETDNNADGSLLRQRVPGAQLPPDVRRSQPADPTPGDPAAVRALIEEFEAGVRRAQQQGGASPVTVPAPKPVTPPGGPMVSRLNRRVPGANLNAAAPAGRVNHPSAPHTAPNPDEVRDLITQFESGVARALTEVSSDHHRHEEGRPQ